MLSTEELSKMTVEQLKALAYDQIVALQQVQTNLVVLNQVLEKKIQNPK